MCTYLNWKKIIIIRNEIRKKNPDKKTKEICKILGEIWQGMTLEEKRVMNDNH